MMETEKEKSGQDVNRLREEEKMPMAVVLAGGRGKRLMPLTEHFPKPLLKVGGKEVLRSILENLEKEGVKKALILTGYKGKLMEDSIGKRIGEMEIYYLREEEPRGSMGAVKRGEDLLEDRFFVVCGDACGYRRYRDFYHFHKEHRGIASVLLAKVSDPCEFGVVQTDAGGRIIAFKEKPDWSEVFSDLANTGIYLLEKEALNYVPVDQVYDFGKDFFPMLVERKLPFYGFADAGFWCDMGDPAAYLYCNLRQSGGVSVLGRNCTVGKNSDIARSLLLDGVKVGDGCQITGAILGNGVTVGDGCRICEGCILGDGTVLPKETVLPPGTVLSGKAVGATHGVSLKELFSEAVLHTAGTVLPSRFWQSLGEAIGKAAAKDPGGTVLITHDQSLPGRAVSEKVGRSAAHHCRTLWAGSGFYTMCAFLSRENRVGFGVHVYKERTGGMAVALFDQNGLPPGKERIREIRDAFEPDAGGEQEGKEPENMEDIRERSVRQYEAAAHGAFSGSLSGMVIGIGRGKPSSDTVSGILASRGAVVTAEGKGRCNVYISPDGRLGEIYDQSGRLDARHLEALLLTKELESGKQVRALPFRAPSVFFEIARAYGSYPAGFSLTPSGKGLDEERAEGGGRRYLFDGCMAVLGVLGMMANEKKNCRELAEQLPAFAVSEQIFDCEEWEKLTFILSGGFIPAGEGVADSIGAGRIRIRALGKRGLSLMAEAADDNDAAMLLSKIKKKLNQRKNFTDHE